MNQNGFTLIELLVVVAILGILSTIVFAFVNDARDEAYTVRAKEEFRQMQTALQLFASDNDGIMPADVSRGLPPGLEAYLAPGNWPDAPWPDSIYDWDNWTPNNLNFNPKEHVYQISIRFCPQGGPLSACNFPDEEWAENFDVNSSAYYCIEGPCRSHSNNSCNHPGYCINCESNSNETICPYN